MISKGNHVKFARFVLLAVSEEAKTWLPGLLRWLSKTSKKIFDDRDSQNIKSPTEVAKQLFADYVKEKKLREPEEKKELLQTVKTFHVEARKKGFVQYIIKELLDSVFVISRIIKVSVRVISLSLPRPWFFWISQKPHPIIVYYYVFSKFGLITNWPL